MGSAASNIDKNGWIQLASHDSQRASTSSIPINYKEFIKFNKRQDQLTHEDFIANKYNIEENKWDKLQLNISIEGYDGTEIVSVAYDNDLQYLYICCRRLVAIVDMNNNDFTIHKTVFEGDWMPDGQAVIINNQLHFFRHVHCLFYEPMSVWARMENKNDLAPYVKGAIYLKKTARKKVLMLMYKDDYVKLYDCKRTKWIKKDVTFLTGIWNWSCVAVNNDNYEIMAGGNKGKSSNYTNGIFVLDLNKWVIMKSRVKCPNEGRFDSVVMNGDFRWLVYGYMRREERFGRDVVEIVVRYYDMTDFGGIEYLHLISEKGLHWKILVGKILCDLKDI